jgi:hypothetical protein
LKGIINYYKNETFFYTNDFKILIEILKRDLMEIKEEKLLVEYLQTLSLICNSKMYHEYNFHYKKELLEFVEKLVYDENQSENLRKEANRTMKNILKENYSVKEKKYDITKDTNNKFKAKVKTEKGTKKKLKKKGEIKSSNSSNEKVEEEEVKVVVKSSNEILNKRRNTIKLMQNDFDVLIDSKDDDDSKKETTPKKKLVKKVIKSTTKKN